MATPRLSETKRAAIEAELKTGKLAIHQIAKKLRVATGTVSNVKRGLGTRQAVDLLRAKENLSDLTRRHKEALKEIDTLRNELNLFSTLDGYARHFKPVEIKPKSGGKGEATAVLCINDWHFEEKVDLAAVNGVNEFNLDVAKRRTTRLWQSAASLIDMCRYRDKIDTIIVAVLGDLITGYIHDELMATNELTPGEAVLAVFDCLISGLEYLKKELKPKEIIVPCVCGNHGRFTKKRWSKKGPGMSFEGILYNLLARWFEARKDKVIRFVLPQGDITYLKVYDRTIRLTHGDNIRYAGGIGGVHVPMRKALDTWNTYMRADYNYFGHWHTDLRGEDYRISGSLIGFSEFSLRIKARYQRPTQAFELQHPRYGATAPFPIILE